MSIKKRGARMSKTTQLTPRQAAKRLGVGLDYIYSLIWAGKLKARKRDGRWVIPARENSPSPWK